MAPLTRTRANKEHTPNALMARYYAQRASAGLIITEATMVMPNTSAFRNEPGIFTDEHMHQWRSITDAVHRQGGKIVLQLWHGGRACIPDFNQGKISIAPSAIAITDHLARAPSGKQPYKEPRSLSKNEVPCIINGFREAAKKAQKAQFDGIELHAANGYLLDSFMRDGANKRQDEYGGTLENRCRLLLETLSAVCEVWESTRVGLRISPLNQFNSMSESHPRHLTEYLCQQLNQYELAYLHIMRHDLFGNASIDLLDIADHHYRGQIIGNMGYDADEAHQDIVNGRVYAVAFGTPYIANPDLVKRFKCNASLASFDEKTLYTGDAKGYTDYPTLDE